MTTEIDFNKLSQSNTIIHKWLDRLKLQKFEVYTFAFQCLKGKYPDGLSSEDKKQLAIDSQSFKYTVDIENDLIKLYIPLIYHCAKIARITLNDDTLSRGMTALRKSVYYYGTKNEGIAAFKCFAYTGVMLAFRQSIDAITKVEHATIVDSDLSSKQKSYIFDSAVDTPVDEESPHEKIQSLKSQFEGLSAKAQLTPIEKLVLRSRIEICSTSVSDWIGFIIETNNLSCSKNYISKVFRRAADKIKNVTADF
jgi:hypothetical protein